MTGTPGTTALSLERLTKSFGATQALVDVSFDVRHGEVHALCGHNGSGKSTAIKILAGYHAPDDGIVRVEGRDVLPIHPADPQGLGLRFVHQDLALVGELSVLDNLRVGAYRRRWSGLIDWKGERARARCALSRFGLHIALDAPVQSLSEGEKAVLGIVRALESPTAEGVRLLVLDEPTVHLSPADVDQLFGAMREVAAGGTGVLFVAHRVKELLSIADRITVLRSGRLVATVPAADVGEDELSELIVGRRLGELYPEKGRADEGERSTGALEVRDLRGVRLERTSLEVRPGEILGLTGLLGSGFDELPYLMFGAERPAAGEVRVDDALITSPSAAAEVGIGLVPADRQRLGGFPRASQRENVTVPILGRFVRRGVLDLSGEREYVADVLRRFNVISAGVDRPLAELSGGNQQKLIVAKWLQTSPFLLLHEPTQGVDIGAKVEIVQLLRDAADRGAGIAIASTDYEDVAGICDRVIVFVNGRPVCELHGQELTEDGVALACLVEPETTIAV